MGWPAALGEAVMTAISAQPSFEVGRVIERAFGSIRRNFAPFLALAAIFGGLPQLLIGLARTDMLGGNADPGGGAVLTLVGAFFSVVGGLIIQGGVVKGAVSDQSGRQASFGDLFQTGLRFALPLLGVGIIYGLMMMVGFFLLIVPGLIVLTAFCVAAPSLVVERLGIFASLQRSRELTRGHRWPVFGVLFVFSVLGALLSVVLSFAALGFAGGASALYVQAGVSGVVGAVQGLLGAAGAAAIYSELRAIKEGAAPESLLSVFD
jgi:hypothetical protein